MLVEFELSPLIRRAWRLYLIKQGS